MLAETQPAGSLVQQYREVRQRSEDICRLLQLEDYLIQPMADASPPKWHLAHVTWFFETFILKAYSEGYESFDERYEALFNSYYNGVGMPFPRARRGLLSRPTVEEIYQYRRFVDDGVARLMADRRDPEIDFRLVLGMHHEQQHQELLYTDLKYNLGNNPLHPSYMQPSPKVSGSPPISLRFHRQAGGVREIGSDEAHTEHFVFDNETPKHELMMQEFGLANRLVTNGEYQEFMADDGYSRAELWLSDGWAFVCGESADKPWRAPLYWLKKDETFELYTLSGLQELDPSEPVCHVSYYEADAYARWRGKRLPREAEWEVVATELPIEGNFVESGMLQAVVATGSDDDMHQMYGDVWEWTQSGYTPYPGFKPLPGTLGEYNGKFMSNQLVLRGGSCVTSVRHIRPTYRNFFYAKDRWQFTGIRLAED